MPLSIGSAIASGVQPDGWSHREMLDAERLLRDNSSNGCRRPATQRKAFCRSRYVGSAYRPRELPRDRSSLETARNPLLVFSEMIGSPKPCR